MMIAMPVPMDLDKPATYPIVLSDALQGRGSKEIFTSIRYNHKPTPSSESSLNSHKLKPTAHGDSSTYDLSFSDGSGEYEYQGIRNSGDGQYALVFDAVKKHFVLYQVDSTFDMNLVNSPPDQDLTGIREPYPQISSSSKQRRKSSSQAKPKQVQTSRTSADTKRRKAEKPKKAKTPPKEPTPDAEDEDSDGGLTVEYPGGAPPPRFLSRPSPLPVRNVNKERSEESDADAEYEEDDENEQNRDVEILELPSPVTNTDNNNIEDEAEEMDVDLDLAAELEQALEKETGGKADESSESEEE